MKKAVLLFMVFALIFTSVTMAQSLDKHQTSRKILQDRSKESRTITTPKPKFHSVLFESFEGVFPPAGWSRQSYGNSPNVWTTTTAMAHSGIRSACVEYGSQDESQDEWLITSAINLSQSPGATLLFWEDQQFWNSYGDHHYVKISTTSQTNPAAFQDLLVMTPNTHTINGFAGDPVEVDLSNYLGESTVYIAFVYTGVWADDWFIDDVTILEPDDHDVRVVSLNLDHHYNPGTTVLPVVNVRNVGLNTESFDVKFGHYNWNGDQVVVETKSVSNLGVGQSQNVNFSSYTFPGEIQYRYFAEAYMASDQDTSNNSIKRAINTFTLQKDNVLVEKATGTWCGFCPGSALAIDLLYHNYPDDLCVLEYHGGDAYEILSSRHRINYYGISGYPTAIFGGTQWIVGGTPADGNWMNVYNNYETAFLAHQDHLTGFSLDIDVVKNGETYNATAQVFYEAASWLKSFRLFFALNESHIYDPWLGLDSLQFVARGIFHDFDGLSLYEGTDPPFSGMQVSHSVSFEVPAGVVSENCQLIVFLQDINTKEVMIVEKTTLPEEGMDCLLGDVNMDMDVTPADALCAFLTYMNGGVVPPGECDNTCALYAADVNCTPDGISPGDALYIFMSYLGGEDPPLDCNPGMLNSTGNNSVLNLVQLESENENEISFAVQLTNPAGLKAFGFDLGYPVELLEFVEVKNPGLTSCWEEIQGQEIVDGVVRVGGFNLEEITTEEAGNLVNITFRKKPSVVGSEEIYFINLTDGLSEAESKNHRVVIALTNVENQQIIQSPDKYSLENNYPNPFNMNTQIAYQVPENTDVQLMIFNSMGQKIRTLVNQEQNQGRYIAFWDGRNEQGAEVSSGIYLYKLMTSEFVQTKKLILMK